MYVLERTFLSCETCVLSNCFLLNNKICIKQYTVILTGPLAKTNSENINVKYNIYVCINVYLESYPFTTGGTFTGVVEVASKSTHSI